MIGSLGLVEFQVLLDNPITEVSEGYMSFFFVPGQQPLESVFWIGD
jgi:hypothetical protein